MKMRKLQRGNNDLKRLPHHLIVEHILPRLPAKSLLRFKTVSKNWLSEISTDAFQKSHLEFSSSSPKFTDNRIGEDYTMFMQPYDESKTIGKQLLQLPSDCITTNKHRSSAAREVTLVEVCNGVLCLYVDGVFRLWNPATNSYKRIIHFSHSVGIYVDLRYFNSSFHGVGFGYVSSTKDYKILVMYMTQNGYGHSYLFSLNTGIWRTLDNLDETYYPSSLDNVSGVCVDETLYWPCAMFGVAGFNLVEEQMNKVIEAPWLCQYKTVDDIFKIKGCLSLSCFKSCFKVKNRVCDVWTLRQQGGSDIWLKLFSIDYTYMSILGFTGDGKFFAHHSGKIKLIDPCRQDTDLSKECTSCGCDYEYIDGYCYFRPAMKYVESLVSF